MSKVSSFNLLRLRRAEDVDVDAAGAVVLVVEAGGAAGLEEETTPERELGKTRTSLARPTIIVREAMIERWLEVAWEHRPSDFEYH